MKNSFIVPFVLLEGLNPGGENPQPGLGSGIGTTDDEQWDWEFWSVNYEWCDADGDQNPGTWNDYVVWWQAHNWNEDMFFAINGRHFNDGPP